MRKSRAQGTRVPVPKPPPQEASNGQLPKSQPICWYCGDSPARGLPVTGLGLQPMYYCSAACAVRSAIEHAEERVRWNKKKGDWQPIPRADGQEKPAEADTVLQAWAESIPDDAPMREKTLSLLGVINEATEKLPIAEAYYLAMSALCHVKERPEYKGVIHA